MGREKYVPHGLQLEVLMLLHHQLEDLGCAEDGYGGIHKHQGLLGLIYLPCLGQVH